MTTPASNLEDRVTILETRLDTILPTLATKTDIARVEGKIDATNERLEGKIDTTNERLEGKIDAMNERLEGKIDAMNVRLDGKIDALGNRLLIRLGGMAVAVAAAKYL